MLLQHSLQSTSVPTTAWESDDYIEVLIATGGSTAGWTALYTLQWN